MNLPYTGPGALNANHIQDLNRAIEYLQNLKHGLLSEEFDDLEAEVESAIVASNEAATDVNGNTGKYIPRSFQRI